VLLAGVLPRLQHLVVEHRPVAAGNGRGTLLADRPPIAVTVFREWRDPPLAQLADGMRSAVAEACDDDVPSWDGAEPFTDWLRTLTARARTLLVVLDQFEEYFQYHPDETGPGTFGTQFPAIVNDPDLRVHFLMSLREDAWSRLDRFKGEIPELFGNYLRIDYLDRAAAHDAIVKPLEHYNETAAEPVGIEPELLDAILRDVRTGRLALAEGNAAGQTPEALAGGDERVETPYLQLVMQRLWAAATANGGRMLTVAVLEELGGAAAIVSGHLTDAMNELPPEDQATAADIFGYLVTPSKTKIAHRASDLAYWAQRPEADVRRVLDDLASGDRRILRRVPPPGDEDVERYEIFHDVLADAVLEWSSDNRNRRQRAAARRERARRLRRRALLVLGVLVLLGAVVAVVIAIANANSEKNKQAAQKRADMQKSVELAGRAETELDADSERSLLYSLAAYQKWHTTDAKQSLAKAFAAARARAAYLKKSSPSCSQCAPPGDERAPPEPVSFVSEQFDFAISASDTRSKTQSSLSNDGRTLAIIRDGRVKLWQPADGKVDTLPEVRGAARVAFIGDGRQLIVLTRKRALLLASADAKGSPLPLGERVDLAAVSADGRYLATASGKTLRVRPVAEPDAGTPVRVRWAPGALAFSPTDAGLLAIAPAVRRTPVVWHWRRERAPSPPEGRTTYGPCSAAVTFSADGRTLVSTAPSGRLQGWSMPAFTQRFEVRPVGDCPSAVRVDADGLRVLVASGNLALILSGRRGRPLAGLGGHSGSIAAASFSPSGGRVATVAADGSARVWDVASGAQLLDLRARGLRGRVAPLATVAFTPDERFVVTADEDGVARMWDVTVEAQLGAWRRRVRSAGVTDDGRVLATVPGGRIVSMTSAGRRESVERFGPKIMYAVFAPSAPRAVGISFTRTGPRLWWLTRDDHKAHRIKARYFQSISISADGRDALVWDDRSLRVWHDGQRGKPIDVRSAEREFGPSSAEISKDGSHALIAPYPRGGRIVDLRTGHSVTLHGVSARIASADFSQDGAQLVTAGDRGARVWDTTTGKGVPLGDELGPVNSVAFSRPDGRDIVSVDSKGTIRVFDATSHAPTATLAPRPDFAYTIAYNSDTKTAVSVGDDGLELKRCEACESPDRLVQHAQSRLTRTPKEAREFIRKVKEG
jgi:WD40 repeat protein